ncbi:MAG: hypothetical protein JJU40_16810 [Rhodobacteraceae bacterium]|nr:hypothetical protein [Paracoccaceae bacterium]
MIRLNFSAEPFCFDTNHGVKLKLAPRNQRARAVCKAIVRLTVLEC